MSSNRPHLMVATPCFGGAVTQRYMQCVIGLMRFSESAGFDVSVELIGYDSLIPRSRNRLVTRFLDHDAATHLFFIDADIGFEPVQVARMLAFGQDVVAGMYPLKLIEWNEAAVARAAGGEAVDSAAIRYVGQFDDEADRLCIDGFLSARFAGTGFMLISRRAFERLMPAFPELRYSAIHTGDPVSSPNQYAFFDTMIEPGTGHYLSEDYAFCHRWRMLGGRVWLDAQSQMMHIGPHEFVGRPAARFAALRDRSRPWSEHGRMAAPSPARP